MSFWVKKHSFINCYYMIFCSQMLQYIICIYTYVYLYLHKHIYI